MKSLIGFYARLVLAILGAAIALQAAPVQAQPVAYPTRPITLIVPATAGGAVDIIARLVALKMADDLGQPVVVENRSGAGGNIGTVAAARAPHDGYTLLFISATQLLNQLITKPQPYDLFTDFELVGQLAEAYEVIAISSKVPANNLAEFATAARAAPAGLNYGSPGLGTVPHLGAEILAQAMNIKMVHVPFRGAADAMRELAAGNIQLSIATQPSVAPFLTGDLVKIVAVAGPKRLGSLPNVMTTAESGYPDVEITFWAGILAPKGTSSEVMSRLNQSMNKAMANADVEAVLQKQGIEAVRGEPDRLLARMKKDAGAYTQILEKVDVTAK